MRLTETLEYYCIDRVSVKFKVLQFFEIKLTSRKLIPLRKKQYAATSRTSVISVGNLTQLVILSVSIMSKIKF